MQNGVDCLTFVHLVITAMNDLEIKFRKITRNNFLRLFRITYAILQPIVWIIRWNFLDQIH